MSWMYLHHVLFGARKHYSGTSWSILKPITLPLYLSLLKITANMFFITDTFSILLFSMGVEQSHLLLIHIPQRGFNNKMLLNRISISCMRWAPEKKRYMESRKRGVINTSDKCSIECNTDLFLLIFDCLFALLLERTAIEEKNTSCVTLWQYLISKLCPFCFIDVSFVQIYLLALISVVAVFIGVFLCRCCILFCFVPFLYGIYFSLFSSNHQGLTMGLQYVDRTSTERI